jgi:hypothetical protein
MRVTCTIDEIELGVPHAQCRLYSVGCFAGKARGHIDQEFLPLVEIPMSAGASSNGLFGVMCVYLYYNC